MTTEAWIFMVGLRVFDVGALIVWLVWFFKLRDDDPDDEDRPDDEDGGGDEPLVPNPPAPGAGRAHGGRIRAPRRERRRRGTPPRPRVHR